MRWTARVSMGLLCLFSAGVQAAPQHVLVGWAGNAPGASVNYEYNFWENCWAGCRAGLLPRQTLW